MRSYNPTMESFIKKVEVSARLEMRPDNTGRITSIFGELDVAIPPMPPLMESKYAILKLCEKGTRIQNVGKRQSENIFYLWFDQSELKQVVEEIKHVRDNAVDGGSISCT